MAISRDINNLVINKVESQQVYDYMVQNNLINDDELYLIQGENEGIIQPDWNQNDETAPDYVKNRTHWIDSDTTTINWDGDFESEGLVTFHMSAGGGDYNYVKVSDLTPAYEDICENGTITIYLPVTDYEQQMKIPIDSIYDKTESGFLFVDFLAVAHVDNYRCTVQGISFEFPESGIYLLRYLSGSSSYYIKSLSWTNETIHPLDEKFLPESVTAQPDWNQNDETAPDYVKNRPFYKTYNIDKLILEEQSFDFVNGDGNRYAVDMSGTENINGETVRRIIDVNKSYIINFDGNEYECVSRFIEDVTCIGNVTIMDMAADEGFPNNEPFFIYRTGSWLLFAINGNAGTHTLSIMEGTRDITKIPAEYLTNADWSVNDESNPAYVKNRTHYSTTLIDIKWDGDITGLDTHNIAGYDLYNVADVTGINFSEDNYLKGSMIASMPNSTQIEPFECDLIIDEFGAYHIGPGSVLAGYIIPNETVAEAAGFPSAGLYLWKLEYSTNAMYVNSLTIENNKKIDEKYIPFKLNNLVDGSGEYSIETADQEAKALGTNSAAMGYGTLVYGDYSHAEGYGSIGMGSVTLSGDANATTYSLSSANSAIEVGKILNYNNNYAKIIACSPDNLTITLDRTLSSEALLNEYVTRVEYDTVVSGDYSHAEGKGVLVFSDAQHVQGKYNISDADNIYAHIVGNGVYDNNRSNAHTLDWSGNAWFAGDVYVGSTSGTNKDEGSVKLMKEVSGTQGQVIGFDEDGNAVAEDKFKFFPCVIDSSTSTVTRLDATAQDLAYSVVYYRDSTCLWVLDTVVSSSIEHSMFIPLVGFNTISASSIDVVFSGTHLNGSHMTITVNISRTAVNSTSIVIDGNDVKIPEVTTSDNGKFLRVVNGAWAAATVPNAEEVAF